MQADVVRDIDDLGALHAEPDSLRHLVLLVDAPRGLDLGRVGNLVRRVLGAETPMVYLHYPRRKPSLSTARGRAPSSRSTVQLWQAMAEVLAPDRASERTSSTLAHRVDDAVAGDVAGNVLVKDDDINAKLITNLLRRAGCRVTLVGDGAAALEAAAETAFDLAIVDLRMPGLDGLDFTRAHRASEVPGTHLPIVALTANAAEQVRAECLRAGMDEFITKPVDPQSLQELIMRFGIPCRSI